MSALSLVYVAREINPEARAESYKARVPVFGDLQIYQGKNMAEGISVGREWDYRKYISGGATNPNKTPIATKMATAQIAIFRVRGWRAIPFARSRISPIFGAMGETAKLDSCGS